MRITVDGERSVIYAFEAIQGFVAVAGRHAEGDLWLSLYFSSPWAIYSEEPAAGQ